MKRPMKTYRVTAIQKVYEIIVEANSKKEAIKIADETEWAGIFCDLFRLE